MKTICSQYLFYVLIFLVFAVFCKETTFSWGEIDKAKLYKVRICKDKSCKGLVYEKKHDETSFVKEIAPGKYYILVAPISRTGKIGEFSKPRAFIIPPESPKLDNPSDNEEIILNNWVGVQLKWKPVKSAKFYEVYINSGNEKKWKFKTKQTKLLFKHKIVGKFSWRVKSFLNDSISSTFSEKRFFRIEKTPPRITNFPSYNVFSLMEIPEKINIKSQGFDSINIRIYYKKAKSHKFKKYLDRSLSSSTFPLKLKGIGFYRVLISGVKGDVEVSGQNVGFEIKDYTLEPNYLSFWVMSGSPKSSFTTKTAPAYTSISSESPGSMYFLGLKYLRNLQKIDLNLEGNLSVNSGFMSYKRAKVDLRLRVNYPTLIISPLVGYSLMHLSVKNSEKASNFLIKNLNLPYFGLSFVYSPDFLTSSRILLDILAIGFKNISKQYAFETKILYEYFLSNRLSILTGAYYDKAYGVFKDLDNPGLEGTKFTQSLLGFKVGMGYLF